MRKWMVLFVLVLVIALSATAVAEAASTAAPEVAKPSISVALGGTDFRTYCAACHGVSARGDGTVAEFLTIAAPDLTRLRKLNAGIFPRERIAEVIDGRTEVKVHGPRDMPVWGDWFSLEAATPDAGGEAWEAIVRARIESLTNYIESIQEN